MLHGESILKSFEAKLTWALEGLIALFLFGMLATVVVLVALRYVFGSSIIGANEIIVILFVYTTSIGAALAIGKGEHLAIVFAVDKLSVKWRRRVDLIRALLVAGINAIAIVYSVQWMSVTGDYLMPSTGLPRWVAQLSIPVGCSLALLFSVFQCVRICDSNRAPGGNRSDSEKEPTT
jgi:TRAP-type C4-dicarboxylate transport system permease small subunit